MHRYMHGVWNLLSSMKDENTWDQEIHHNNVNVNENENENEEENEIENESETRMRIRECEQKYRAKRNWRKAVELIRGS